MMNPDPTKRNVRLTVEYDGTRYVGWQHQKNGLSVQEALEKALAKHLGERVTLMAAGRTDAGVHALGQVVNFHTATTLTPRAIWKGLLPLLPDDVTVVDAQEADPHFHARRSARLRWYRYFIMNRSVSPAIGRQYCTYVPYRLDLSRMRKAAAILDGDHDFKAFRAISCNAVRTNLSMNPIVITEMPDSLICFDFRCQSFLQNMVRIMVGILVECGRGKMELEQVHDMLRTGERANDARTLAPNGLFLYRVCYTDEEVAVALASSR